MTNKSRYFLVGAAVVLLVGLGGGLVAYMAYHRVAGVPAGLPAELRYVPSDAQMVAYADVRSVMASDMRRELERMTTGRRQQQMHEFAGIDFEKDVSHVVAFMQADPNEPAPNAPGPNAGVPAPPQPPSVLVLAQGKFDQPRVEQFIKDHGGAVEDYHGKHFMIRRPDMPPANTDTPNPNPNAIPTPPPPPTPNLQAPRRFQPEIAIGFVQPDLIAVGPAEMVRHAMDASTATANITTNSDLMALMRDESSANAWVVGRFDAVSRRMGLPSAMRAQVPQLRLVSASARIDGGVKATIKAQTADAAAGDQLRDVVRGAISFAKLQGGSKPELQSALQTVELGGTGTNVQLSFMMTPDSLRALHPHGPPIDSPPPPPAINK